MRALVIEHDQFSLPGIVGERLEHHGVELEPLLVVADIAHPVSDVEFPDPRGYDLVVAMGSPWSVYDTDTIGTWIGRELDLLRTAVDEDVPVFGICFGGQALAATLGATVERSPQPEIGWYQVVPTSAGVVADGPWFQWHFDRFELPEGATALATGELGIQAFTIGCHLGLQFHPEITADVLATWLDVAERTTLEGLGIDPDTLLAETKERQEEARPHTEALVDHFLTEIARLR
jgi:GMP synthase-like glutamine amidotransferase